MSLYRYTRSYTFGKVKYTPNKNSAGKGKCFLTIVSEGYYTDGYGYEVHSEYSSEVKNSLNLKAGDRVKFQAGIGVGIINEGWKRARSVKKVEDK